MSGAPAGPRTRVDFGRTILVSRGPRWSLRLDVRTAVSCTVFGLLTAVAVLVSLAYGTYDIPLGEVLRTLTGGGEGGTRKIVVEWRLPRVLLAVLFGAALAVAGAIFQSVSRNPSAHRTSSASPPAPTPARSSSC